MSSSSSTPAMEGEGSDGTPSASFSRGLMNVPETGLEFSSSKVSFLIARDFLEGVPLLEDFASVLARRLLPLDGVPLDGDAKGVVGKDFVVGVLRTSLSNAAVAGETLEGVGGMLFVDPLRELLREVEEELKDELKELLLLLKEWFREPAL